MQAVTYDSIKLAGQIGAYVLAVAAVPFALKYAMADLRKDHLSLVEQAQKDHATTSHEIGILGKKVDTIQETLSEIKVNAARHDQRAADIQERVKSIDGRVTFLEQKASR